jgi:hypothetical protein
MRNTEFLIDKGLHTAQAFAIGMGAALVLPILTYFTDSPVANNITTALVPSRIVIQLIQKEAVFGKCVEKGHKPKDCRLVADNLFDGDGKNFGVDHSDSGFFGYFASIPLNAIMCYLATYLTLTGIETIYALSYYEEDEYDD